MRSESFCIEHNPVAAADTATAAAAKADVDASINIFLIVLDGVMCVCDVSARFLVRVQPRAEQVTAISKQYNRKSSNSRSSRASSSVNAEFVHGARVRRESLGAQGGNTGSARTQA